MFKYLNVKTDGTEKILAKLKTPYRIEGKEDSLDKIRPLYNSSVRDAVKAYFVNTGKRNVIVVCANPADNYTSDITTPYSYNGKGADDDY